jgi:hypothetical protein
MKKSEMIDIIRKIVSKRNNSHYLYEADEHAKEILNEITNAGMLPPFTYLKKIGTLDTAWEPENDEDD